MATRRALLGTSLVLAACAAGTACSASAQPAVSTLQKIAQSGQIGLGIRDRSPPFGYTNGEGAVGYAIDVCMHVVAAVKRELGRPDLRVAMRPVLSASRFALLADGTIDMDCGTTSNTAERQRQFAFSNTYFLTANRFVSRKSDGFGHIADLRGRTMAVTANTTSLAQLRAADRALGLGLTLRIVANTGEGFRSFAQGEVDAFVSDDIILAALVAGSAAPAAFLVSAERFGPLEPYAIMLRRDDPVFKALVDRATSQLLRSAEGPTLYERWFNAPLPGRGLNLGMAMSPELRRVFAAPNDRADTIY